MQQIFRRVIGPQLASIYSHYHFGGKDDSETCAHLTSVPQTHWNEHTMECFDLIDKQTSSAVEASCAVLSIIFILYYAHSLVKLSLLWFTSFTENGFRSIYELRQKTRTIPFDLRQSECSCFAERPRKSEKQK